MRRAIGGGHSKRDATVHGLRITTTLCGHTEWQGWGGQRRLQVRAAGDIHVRTLAESAGVHDVTGLAGVARGHVTNVAVGVTACCHNKHQHTFNPHPILSQFSSTFLPQFRNDTLEIFSSIISSDLTILCCRTIHKYTNSHKYTNLL